VKIARRQLRRVIREVISEYRRPRRSSRDYSHVSELDPQSSFDEFVWQLKINVLTGEDIPMPDRDVRKLYSDWQNGIISWDNAQAEVAELAF